MMLFSLVEMVEKESFNFFEFINKYQDWLGIGSLLVVGLIIFAVHYVRTSLFSNTSKVKELDLSKVEQIPSQDLIGIDDIGHNMFIDSYTGTHTSVIETVGIPYKTISEQEKDGVNSGYINFLNAINFPFSKHIVSRKIDIETTEDIYMKAYKRNEKNLDELETQALILKKQLENLSADDELHKQYNRIIDRIILLKKSLIYLEAQINYVESTTSSIAGSTKSVYYSTSADLDAEALKGLEPSEEIFAYENNVRDRIVAMINSLGGVGVKATMLNDIELLDLARTHYKPHSSNIFKTKHLINQSNLDSDVSLNTEVYARFKIHEALEKAKEVTNGKED